MEQTSLFPDIEQVTSTKVVTVGTWAGKMEDPHFGITGAQVQVQVFLLLCSDLGNTNRPT
jgi:hypothetical protein